MKRWQAVEVVWRDAHGGDLGWTNPENLEHRPVKVRTVGMLYRRNRDGISVVMSKVGAEIGAYIFIPSGWIESVEELTKKES